MRLTSPNYCTLVINKNLLVLDCLVKWNADLGEGGHKNQKHDDKDKTSVEHDSKRRVHSVCKFNLIDGLKNFKVQKWRASRIGDVREREMHVQCENYMSIIDICIYMCQSIQQVSWKEDPEIV